MEIMAVVEADREGVVADPPVECPIDAAEQSFGGRHALGHQLLAEENGFAPELLDPAIEFSPHIDEEDGLETIAQAVSQPGRDPAVEEDTGRKRLGEDEPDRSLGAGGSQACLGFGLPVGEPLWPHGARH